jgi:nucleotide-binding universal stress UspA family protein
MPGLPFCEKPDPIARGLNMFKDLIVHLDGTEEDNVRLAQAEAIALRFEAHLIGLFTNPLPEYAYVLAIQSGLAPMGPLVELEQELRKDGDVAVARLKERFKKLAIQSEVRRIDAGASELPRFCASAARWSDLFVATAPYRGEDSPGCDALVESVLFGSGHAVYLIPEQFKTSGGVRNVLVAWRDTRESARALAEAMPFLRTAANARLVMVDESDEGDNHEDALNIAAHFRRCGVKADLRSVKAAGLRVSEVLLEEVHKTSADLIVMGAYGHSRWSERILGGTTREMIAGAEVPIFIAH